MPEEWATQSLGVEIYAQSVDSDKLALFVNAFARRDDSVTSTFMAPLFGMINVDGVTVTFKRNMIDIEQRMRRGEPEQTSLISALTREIVTALDIRTAREVIARSRILIPTENPQGKLLEHLLHPDLAQGKGKPLTSARLSLEYEVEDSVLRLTIVPSQGSAAMRRPHLSARVEFLFRNMSDKRLFTLLSEPERYRAPGLALLRSLLNGDAR